MEEVDQRRALAYEESKRALAQQEAVLDALRARTGILLTAISITATLLAARALDEVGFSTLAWVAIGAFVVAGGFAFAVLWPRGEWHFSTNAKVILSGYVEDPEPATIDEMHTELATFNQSRWEENSSRLRTLFWLFRLSALFLIIQVAIWLIVLGDSPSDQRQDPRQGAAPRQEGADRRPGSPTTASRTGARQGAAEKAAP